MTELCEILFISCLVMAFQLILILLGLTTTIFLRREIKRDRRLKIMKKTNRISKTVTPAKCIYLGLDMARKGKKIATVVGVEKKIKTNK